MKLLPKKIEVPDIDLQHMQARIFLNPGIMTDSSKVQIKRYFKDNPTESYLNEIRTLVRQDLLHWLEAKNILSPDTLENPASSSPQALPTLQKIYRHIKQNAGNRYEVTVAESNYAQFLQSDSTEGIKQIFAHNPNFDLFKPFNSSDYKIKSKATVTYPVSLFANAPKILTMVMSEYLDPMVTWANSAVKSADIQKNKACLLTYELLVRQGIHIYEEALEEAKSGMKSTDVGVRNTAIALFEALFEKEIGFEEALAIVTSTSNQPSSYHLFKGLVMKEKFFTEAVTAAQFGINNNKEEIRNAAIDLFSALFEKNTGFSEALEITKIPRHGPSTINLFKALVKKDKYFDQALVTAQDGILSGDWESHTSATELFKTLFEKDIGFNEAFRVVNHGIKSSNQTIRSGVIFLSFDLFTMWKNHKETIKFATKWMNSQHLDVQLCTLGLFTNLVEINQGCAEAKAAAKIGIRNRNYEVKSASQNLLATIEKQKI